MRVDLYSRGTMAGMLMNNPVRRATDTILFLAFEQRRRGATRTRARLRHLHLLRISTHIGSSVSQACN